MVSMRRLVVAIFVSRGSNNVLLQLRAFVRFIAAVHSSVFLFVWLCVFIAFLYFHCSYTHVLWRGGGL